MNSLLIKNGYLLDPANGIDQLGDLLVLDGMIAAVGEISPALYEGRSDIQTTSLGFRGDEDWRKAPQSDSRSGKISLGRCRQKIWRGRMVRESRAWQCACPVRQWLYVVYLPYGKGSKREPFCGLAFRLGSGGELPCCPGSPGGRRLDKEPSLAILFNRKKLSLGFAEPFTFD